MIVKYFAWIKDVTSCHKENLNYSKIKTVNELKLYLITKYPDLKKHIDQNILRFAVNKEYAPYNIELHIEDEIAVFPPVSGG